MHENDEQNIDRFATCGAGISDRLSVGLLTRGVTTRVSTETPDPLGTAFPLTWPGNQAQESSPLRFRRELGLSGLADLPPEYSIAHRTQQHADRYLECR